MAGVAVRVPFQVILMLGLGLPEWTDRLEFGHHLARPQPRSLDIGDGVERDALLLVVGEEDCRTVAGADVVALPVSGRRIVDLEKELEQPAVAGLRRIEDDLDRLGVVAVVAVGRIENLAAGIADPGRNHAWEAADQILHPPETAAGKYRAFIGHG